MVLRLEIMITISFHQCLTKINWQPQTFFEVMLDILAWGLCLYLYDTQRFASPQFLTVESYKQVCMFVKMFAQNIYRRFKRQNDFKKEEQNGLIMPLIKPNNTLCSNLQIQQTFWLQ